MDRGDLCMQHTHIRQDIFWWISCPDRAQTGPLLAAYNPGV